jgi:hypothetical protein
LLGGGLFFYARIGGAAIFFANCGEKKNVTIYKK